MTTIETHCDIVSTIVHAGGASFMAAIIGDELPPNPDEIRYLDEHDYTDADFEGIPEDDYMQDERDDMWERHYMQDSWGPYLA